MVLRSPRLIFLFAVLSCSSLLLGTALKSTATMAASRELDTDKNRPVAKVINLLQAMVKQLEKEGEEDEEVYEKMACWCKTNNQEKTDAIKTASAHMKDLASKIEELTANSAQLKMEIETHKEEVKDNKDALEKATGLRGKQIDAFKTEEKNMLSTINALKDASGVLEKRKGTSLLQLRTTRRTTVTSALRHAFANHASFLESALTPYQRQTAMSFVQDSDEAAPSSEINGIIDQMQETFAANLKGSQDDESKNQKAYEDLKGAKKDEISTGEKQIETKTQQVADADEKKAQAKQDLKDTTAQRAKDEEFLGMLKEKCAATDTEFAERRKTRQLETEAVGKALAVLNGDDAHDTFARTFSSSFVQVESNSRFKARARSASQYLAKEALKLDSSLLSSLAVRVRLDAFTKVKQAINDMIAQLGREKAEEIKHKDFCVDELNSNRLETELKDRKKKDVLALIEDLEMSIKELTEAIAKLKSEIGELQVQLKRAGEDREMQNKEFQQTIADQKATQKLLNNALVVLEGFYGKDSSFLQGPAPPAGFKDYKKNEQSGGVMGLMKNIIADAKGLEAEALADEENAQKAYESFVNETNASIKSRSKELVNKSENLAQAESDLVEAKENKATLELELETLATTKATLHHNCDFLLENFDMRQTARDDEVEALKQALAILAGA